jgi:TolB-like protein/lipopolysaccharide biosynthesis regulator YciM
MDPTTENSPEHQEPSPDARLDSWKEIASYLKRDIRTVQLWEKKEGLPVHRHTHASRASVYAFAGEVDSWQVARRTKLEEPPEAPKIGLLVEPEPARAAEVGERRPASHIAIAVAALALAIAAVSLLYWYRTTRLKAAPYEHATIAVLPFEDLSAGPLEGYLADGLTDELITDLGRTNELRLISRTSVLRFKGRQQPLPQIAQELHANLVLEGTVVYSGNRARVTAQLIDAKSDQHIWANSYERSYKNIITLQDEIAGQVATAVLLKLTGGSVEPSTAAAKVDPEVRTAYLRGRYFWNKRDEPGLKQAILYFNEAIAKDSNYAPAYAGLADCYNLLSVWGSLSSRETFPKAKDAALKALQLDPTSAEAYTSLAFATYRNDWDFAGAEKYFRKATQLNPNYATAHQWYGEFLGDLRRYDQSIAESQQAEQLDPLSDIVGSDLADAYLHAGRYPEAVDELKKILAIDPGFSPAHLYLASAYFLEGKPAEDAEEKEVYARLTGDTHPLQVMQIKREWTSGDPIKARQQLQALLKRPRTGPFFDYFTIAQLYLTVGDEEKAFECLETAYRERSWWLVTLLVDPGFASVRNDPRLLDLARRVGLPGV